MTDEKLLTALRRTADLGLGSSPDEAIAARVVGRAQAATTGGTARARGRRPGPAVLAIAAGVTAAIWLALASGSGPRRLDAIAEARAALAVHGGIAHSVITQIEPRPDPIASGVTETWSAASPARWRVREGAAARNAGYTRNRRFVPARGHRDYSYANGELRSYTPQFNELEILTAIPDGSPTTKNHALLGLRGNDPAAVLRRRLAGGDFSDRGLRTVDGRTVRRLVSTTRFKNGRVDTLTYDVDPATFGPVQVAAGTRRPGQAPSRLRVKLAFEVLRDTRANRRLLTTRVPPGTRILRRKAILPKSAHRYLRQRGTGVR